MASARDLKKQIRSVSNTTKITRTMEMVATAKSKRAQGRVESALPYTDKLRSILASLKDAGTIAHALLEEREVKRSALLILTANRGLCGGYNANVLSAAEKWHREEISAGREADIYVVGRKGVARLRYLRIESHRQYTHFGDEPSFAEVDEVASEFLARFLSGELDRVVAASTRYISAANQRVELAQILPIPGETEDAGDETAGGEVDYLFEPDRETILKTLLPLSVKQSVYRLFLEAAVSEHIARRVAMKNASDNAEEMLGFYRRKYNRERQAGITQQIMEIVGGAEALS